MDLFIILVSRIYNSCPARGQSGFVVVTVCLSIAGDVS